MVARIVVLACKGEEGPNVFSLSKWGRAMWGRLGSEYNGDQVWVCLYHPFDIQLGMWSLRFGDWAGGQI